MGLSPHCTQSSHAASLCAKYQYAANYVVLKKRNNAQGLPNQKDTYYRVVWSVMLARGTSFWTWWITRYIFYDKYNDMRLAVYTQFALWCNTGHLHQLTKSAGAVVDLWLAYWSAGQGLHFALRQIWEKKYIASRWIHWVPGIGYRDMKAAGLKSNTYIPSGL